MQGREQKAKGEALVGWFAEGPARQRSLGIGVGNFSPLQRRKVAAGARAVQWPEPVRECWHMPCLSVCCGQFDMALALLE